MKGSPFQGTREHTQRLSRTRQRSQYEEKQSTALTRLRIESAGALLQGLAVLEGLTTLRALSLGGPGVPNRRADRVGSRLWARTGSTSAPSWACPRQLEAQRNSRPLRLTLRPWPHGPHAQWPNAAAASPARTAAAFCSQGSIGPILLAEAEPAGSAAQAVVHTLDRDGCQGAGAQQLHREDLGSAGQRGRSCGVLRGHHARCATSATASW